jgi:plastocyanin
LKLKFLAASFAACIAFAACADSNTAAPAAVSEPVAVTHSEVTGIVPRNAIVTLVAPGSESAPVEPVLMDQISKQFIPNVLIVRPGQPVKFHNGEDMNHNVTVLRRISGSEVFNASTEPGQTYTHAFDRLAQYHVRCDIHEGMEATVIVARGPLTTIARDDGSFTFPNVALGSYTASVTFEGRTVEQPLEVKSARTELKLAR